MHEMSIAANILEIAEQQAAQAQARIINRIEVEVGLLAGVEISALEFCFETARMMSDLTSSSALVIHPVAGRGRCPDCRLDFPVEFFVVLCPVCGQTNVKILQGRELKVRSINVD
ncbi:MAG: hydrogenase maturation nickel metallochaperone HypA [Gemmatimonadales bacterium]|nr:hydrogenase maturation nickel metallochaperone HypA [Gemmatimonadales bacterium]